MLNSPLQLVKQCNEGAHKMERTEQMYTLHTQLDFSKVNKVGALPAHPPYSLVLVVVGASRDICLGDPLSFPDSGAWRCHGLSRTAPPPA